ncbi:MAG: zinc ribbon domain-containing protein [Clostridia bacterium]|nr:zinc ribbon domain-containing protein [Clostridia bacterium]
MAKFCTQCGSEIADNIKFCTNCGAKAPEAEIQPESNGYRMAQPQMQYQPPVYQVQQSQMPPPAAFEDDYSGNENNTAREPVSGRRSGEPKVKGTKYEPITTGGYIGIMLLMCIPIVGFVLMIVWAVGGCQKVNKRNLARASLIMTAIGLIISLIIGLAVRSVFNKAVDELENSGAFDMFEQVGLLDDERNADGSGLLIIDGSEPETSSEGSSDALDALSALSALGELGNMEDVSELSELADVLSGLEALTGEDGGEGLTELIEDVEKINAEAEAQSDGWPKSLRPYPGGSSSAVASYRTEISGTTREEMLSYIDDLKKDGFKFTDFYDFGMSEDDMLSMDGWWATDGKLYLSLSYYDGKVTIDHMDELPDLSSYFD